MTIKVQRREISYVRKGLGVRVNVTIDGDSLNKDELKKAADGLASDVMHDLVGALYVNATLSKIKVR